MVERDLVKPFHHAKGYNRVRALASRNDHTHLHQDKVSRHGCLGSDSLEPCLVQLADSSSYTHLKTLGVVVKLKDVELPFLQQILHGLYIDGGVRQ
ncbi:hypothetical protein VNO77_02389 [Canavalia gladiata]|uniref:Uncharacterized protein n=1 Tax=Canavalia gladiata TaxID=3824 RepID=A0AAN9MY80_CANGL